MASADGTIRPRASPVSFTTPTKDLILALRSGGLPAAAALVGHYVGADDGDTTVEARDLRDLSNNSDEIVRGYWLFSVRVEDVMKGRTTEGEYDR